MKTTVVNILRDEYDLYVGRPSKYGNPYTVGLNGNAETCVKLFEAYARKRISSDAEFREAIKDCYGKRLACWCKSPPCHAFVIAGLAEELHAIDV